MLYAPVLDVISSRTVVLLHIFSVVSSHLVFLTIPNQLKLRSVSVRPKTETSKQRLQYKALGARWICSLARTFLCSANFCFSEVKKWSPLSLESPCHKSFSRYKRKRRMFPWKIEPFKLFLLMRKTVQYFLKWASLVYFSIEYDTKLIASITFTN